MNPEDGANTPSRLFLRVDEVSWADYSEYGARGIVRRPFGAGERVTFQLIMLAESLRVAGRGRPGLSVDSVTKSTFTLVGIVRSIRVARPSPRVPNPMASMLVDAGLPVTVRASRRAIEGLGQRGRLLISATGAVEAICFRYWWVTPMRPLKGKVERIEVTADDATFLELSEFEPAPRP
jgi:hypothetical protein